MLAPKGSGSPILPIQFGLILQHTPVGWSCLPAWGCTLRMSSGVGSACPRPPGGWHSAALVTGTATFPDLCSRGSGSVSVLVVGAAGCRLPGGRGHVELRPRLSSCLTHRCSVQPRAGSPIEVNWDAAAARPQTQTVWAHGRVLTWMSNWEQQLLPRWVQIDIKVTACTVRDARNTCAIPMQVNTALVWGCSVVRLCKQG